jgi:single-strand DNA-binding protein
MTTITGNVGKDPSFRYTASGKAVASFSLAHTPRAKNDAGEWVDAGETIWYRVTAWEDLAEQVANTITKGMRMEVELTAKGVQDRPWTDKDGNERVSTNECTAARITLKDGTVLGSTVVRTKAADVDTSADPWATSPAVDIPF